MVAGLRWMVATCSGTGWRRMRSTEAPTSAPSRGRWGSPGRMRTVGQPRAGRHASGAAAAAAERAAEPDALLMLLAPRGRATSGRLRGWSSRTGGSCRSTAIGCWVRCTTRTTWSRSRCCELGSRSRASTADGRCADAHAAAVVERSGTLDISVNVISDQDVQGTPIVEMSVKDYLRPVEVTVRSKFRTWRAAARHMIRQARGDPDLWRHV
jgi:NAD(P)-dependent dehydrogenase (short-subunit alcohol dehydrogenase family)